MSFGFGFSLPNSLGTAGSRPPISGGLIQWNKRGTGLTFTNAGLSQWDDQSGLGHHLLQSVAGSKPQPMVTGANVIQNGDFAADVVWTKNTGITIAGGLLVFTAVGSGNSAYQECNILNNQTYRVTFTYTHTSGSGVRASVGGINGTTRNTSGTFVEDIVVTGATRTDFRMVSAGGAETGTVDDVTCVLLTAGDGSIYFTGITTAGANTYMQAAYTLNQPFTVGILFQPDSFTAGRTVFSGVTAATSLAQITADPSYRMNAGANTATFNGPAVNAYGSLVCVFNNAASISQLNSAAPTTGRAASTNNAGGITLGGSITGASNSNIIVKELVVYNVALSLAEINLTATYLAQVGAQ